MTVTITGGKYAIQPLTAAGTTSVTIGAATFVSGDFGATQRMVALYTSANVFKGIAWVRRFTSTTALELENRFVDPITGLYATQVVGDQVLVSKNSNESAVTGFAVSIPNNTVTVTDNILMGTAGSETSLCFYEENLQFTTAQGFQFNGGVSVFGKLMTYDGVSKESFVWSRECTIRPNETYPAGGGSPAYNIWGTGGTSAHMFFFGGALGTPMRRSFFIGAQGTNATNKSYACYGTRIYHSAASPSTGGNWASNPTRHLLYKTIHEADYSNANLIVWGNGDFQGQFLSFPQYGAGSPLGVFRASGVASFGASANNRTIVADLGTGAFIDDLNNGTYTFTNTITPAVNVVRHPGGATPITMQFSDDYTNLQPNTTVVLRRSVDSVVASSVVNTQESTFTATAVQATYSATGNGVATPTAFYTSFDYAIKCYGYKPISGNHSTYTYSLGTAGNGTNLKLGGLTNQVAEPTNTKATLAEALALSSKITGNSATDTATITASATLDEKYDYLVAWGCSSAALAQFPSLSSYPVDASGTTSVELMKLVVSAGATLSAGTKLKDMSGTKNVLINGTATFNRATITWTPSAYADQWQVGNGGVLNLTGGTLFTVNPTTGLGYGSAATAMFRSGSTLNLADSTVVYNIVSSGSGTFFANTEAGSTWNISNSTLTLNCPNGAQVAVHAYFLPASVINNFTVNGTATNVVWQMGYTSNNSKMVGFKYGGAIFGNGTSNILMDTYTYTGSLTSIPNTFGSSNKWYWVDPAMNAGGLFRWAAGTTVSGNDSFFGVIGFRPVITMDKVGYAPKARFTPSAMATRYPSFQVQSTEFASLALSNFFRDPTFMPSTDGFLPFVDSLDAKNVINTINWTADFRQKGWLANSVTFTAATAKKGLVTYTASGAVDANYINDTTGATDAALITVNETTKVIAAASGTLAWSAQRMYNALVNKWASFAIEQNIVAASTGGTLSLADYTVDESIRFVRGLTTDLVSQVRTTGIIESQANEIPVADVNGSRASVTGLDPQGFGVTWFLRSRPHTVLGDGVWTEISGTGNVSTILVSSGTYDVQVRASGYEWEDSLTLNTDVSLTLNAGLRYHVSANNTPQWQMSYNSALADAFQFDDTSNKVAVTNTTGGIITPGFAELYQATQRIQHLPDLVWTWTSPVTANATSQKILIPTGNPISMFLTDASTNTVKITCPVIHADNGSSADDRVRGNPTGYSIILGSPATAESAGLQAAIVADILAATLKANIKYVNDVPVDGTGAEGDEWGPATEVAP
jgi:hypothetical protein